MMKFEIDPQHPTDILYDCGHQLEMLRDFLSYSGDHFALSDRARTGFAEILGAIVVTLDKVHDCCAKKPAPGLRVV